MKYLFYTHLFVLFVFFLKQVEKEGVNNVSVPDVLYELRKYRMGLIQTPDQLYFSYQAIIEGIKALKDPVSTSKTHRTLYIYLFQNHEP